MWIYSPLTNSHGKAFTDENGGFVFLSDSDIWESSNLVLQTQITNRRGKKKNKPYGIELDRSFSPPALAYPPLMTTLPDTVMNPLEEIQVRSFPVDTVDNSDLDDDAIVYQLSEVDVNALRVRGLTVARLSNMSLRRKKTNSSTRRCATIPMISRLSSNR